MQLCFTYYFGIGLCDKYIYTLAQFVVGMDGSISMEGKNSTESGVEKFVRYSAGPPTI
jgi:hypothetical protein